jgi:D-alanyl-D-alanine carboxypeptidase
VVHHANAKPDAATKPATPAATDPSAAKPAKPKAAAKPKTTAPKTSGETKPAG